MCCTNPDNVNCFGNIFPNLNFVFAPICAARPVHIQSDQYRSYSTVKQRRAVGAAPFIPMVSNQKQRCGSEFANKISIHQRSEPTNEGKTRRFKVTRELCHELFHYVRHHIVTATGLENSPQSFDVYTVSQSRSMVTSAENAVPENSPQPIGELCTRPIYRNYYAKLVRKMAWYKILIHVLIV